MYEFEWDETKNKSNVKKHDIDFEDAKSVFYDKKRIDRLDNRKKHTEERHQTIGIVEDIVMFVVWTKREEKYRIISARVAKKDEREEYYEKV